ncbi:hypothetical protein QE152_g29722 [Popillia japonica]|uniref:Uncharacterized protein n=1 Tax=Popillia japonica TaxID=7064 RepID=A0AAW1JGF1_POPJA
MLKKFVRKKRILMDSKMNALEEKFRNPEIRNFYEDVKKAKGGKKTKSTERWKEHFEELLNKGNDDRRGEKCIEQARADRMETINPPSLEDVERVIASMKDNKSTGENGISSEMIKRIGDILQGKITELIVQVWREENYQKPA